MLRSILISILLFSLTLPASAGIKEIKERMRTRSPKIATLLAKKTVGEAADGYLKEVKSGTLAEDEKKLIEGENADRKLIYDAVARKLGTDSTKVGKNRALKIFELAKKGTMLQKEDGTWYEK